MDKLIEHNENLETPVYLPSHLKSLKEKHESFEVPDLETTISSDKNPHHWLQQNLAQIKQFQYRFFQHIILNEDTVSQKDLFTCSVKIPQIYIPINMGTMRSECLR